MTMNLHPTCQAEDMGGHPACGLPATLQTKPDSIGTIHFYCHKHRINRHVWKDEELSPMPPTDAMRDALVAALDEQLAATEKAATGGFNWMKRVEVAIRSPYKNYFTKTVGECARVRSELDRLTTWIRCLYEQGHLDRVDSSVARGYLENLPPAPAPK